MIPTIACTLAIALTASLGRWQLNRAEEKRNLQRQYKSMQTQPEIAIRGKEKDSLDHLQFSPLSAKGIFNATGQIFIDNQIEEERAGYYVMSPLKLSDGIHYLLVNRGWIARGPDYPKPPIVNLPHGEVVLQGYGALPVKRFLELSTDTVQGSVWQNVTFERYEKATGLRLLPIILNQTKDNESGLKPVIQKPEFGITTHQGYAFQWFSLSAFAAIFYLFVNIRIIKS